MDELERNQNESNLPPQPQSSGSGPNSLNELRRQAAALNAASDNALRNALSGNSAAYLASTRQAGGQ
jgi:hypothetical protein